MFSFMIKTLLRPESLANLLHSIDRFYPATPVFVADDSPDTYPEVCAPYDNVTYMPYPYDIGIGTCYNDICDRIQTPYTVILDDDFIFTEDTQIERFEPWLEHGIFDLVGGRVWSCVRKAFQGFTGFFYSDGHTVTSLRKIDQENVAVAAQVDVTMNFWAARTDALKKVRWNTELKVCRHEDFFLRFIGEQPLKRRGLPDDAVTGEKHSVGFLPDVSVLHDNRSFTGKDKNPEYMWHRKGRFPDFRQIFIDIWGFEFV